jgi:hypothetical protein
MYSGRCMGVTMTHPLPPLKRGRLSGEAQFMEIPDVISSFSILNFQFSIQKSGEG